MEHNLSKKDNVKQVNYKEKAHHNRKMEETGLKKAEIEEQKLEIVVRRKATWSKKEEWQSKREEIHCQEDQMNFKLQLIKTKKEFENEGLTRKRLSSSFLKWNSSKSGKKSHIINHLHLTSLFKQLVASLFHVTHQLSSMEVRICILWNGFIQFIV